MPGFKKSSRDRYEEAIDRVRSAHRETIAPAHMTIECPRCRTKQVISDVPGRRKCLNCGFELSPEVFRSRR